MISRITIRWTAPPLTQFGSRYRGLRLGPLLYGDLFDYAKANGIATIACEYNVVPPNEPSRVFHDPFGFR